MTLSNNSISTLLLCAFRYTRGRQTYMPSLIRELLMEQWIHVDTHIKQLIKKEIITDKHDLGVWQEVLNRDT